MRIHLNKRHLCARPRIKVQMIHLLATEDHVTSAEMPPASFLIFHIFCCRFDKENYDPHGVASHSQPKDIRRLSFVGASRSKAAGGIINGSSISSSVSLSVAIVSTDLNHFLPGSVGFCDLRPHFIRNMTIHSARMWACLVASVVCGVLVRVDVVTAGSLSSKRELFATTYTVYTAHTHTS